MDSPQSEERSHRPICYSTPPPTGTIMEELPTPTGTCEGRSEAVKLLKHKINEILQEESSIHVPVDDTATENDDSLANFSNGEMEAEYCQQLRTLKNEAEATATLVQAELVALRGRHEEEKRIWMQTAQEMRRRNDELESRISLLSLKDAERGKLIDNAASQSALGSASKAGADANTNTNGQKIDKEGGGGAFGFGIRSLAQRWGGSSPVRSTGISVPLMQQRQDLEEELESRATDKHSDTECGPSHESVSEDQSVEVKRLLSSIVSLEEQLRQSEHNNKILEQRLRIVKESGDAVIRSLNEEISEVAEEHARSESAMIKELAMLDSQRRAEKEEYEKRIHGWMAHDTNRKLEIEEYQKRIQSLLTTVKSLEMKVDQGDESGTIETAVSSSWDKEAEQEMHKNLIAYIELLQGSGKRGESGKKSGGGKKRRPLITSINEAFDVEFNANPNVADEMIEYYKSRPELKDFTLKSELPRMDYEVLVKDEQTGKDQKLVSTDSIRSYFTSLEENSDTLDEELDIILRAANQSLLADPLAILTGEGEGKLVHSGSFHSTLIATECLFQIDLRKVGERRVKVRCELAVCVPSGSDGVGRTTSKRERLDGDRNASSEEEEEGKAEISATLELARANLAIQFSPSPLSTPSGPLIKYTLLDIKPTIASYEEGSDNARAIRTAASVLARDRFTHIRVSDQDSSVVQTRPTASKRFLSRFSSSIRSTGDAVKV